MSNYNNSKSDIKNGCAWCDGRTCMHKDHCRFKSYVIQSCDGNIFIFFIILLYLNCLLLPSLFILIIVIIMIK